MQIGKRVDRRLKAIAAMESRESRILALNVLALQLLAKSPVQLKVREMLKKEQKDLNN